jgi:septum formation protein
MYRNFPFNLVLASASPRRKELLEQLGFVFNIEVKPVDETPNPLQTPSEVAQNIAAQKMGVFNLDDYPANTIIISADTVVAIDGMILGKPSSHFDAAVMLKSLSGRTHEVVTGVCLKSASKSISFCEVTKVSFSELSDADIEYYIDNYKPFDKAGSYGIQEWIGLGFIAAIHGSYTNVVGLPTEAIRRALLSFNEE